MRRVVEIPGLIIHMLVSSEDEAFIACNFSELKFEQFANKLYLKGILNFVASFDKYNKKYTIFRSMPTSKVWGVIIQDNYKIEINLSEENAYRHVRETGSKIKNDPQHHKYDNGYLCISGYLDEKQDVDFKYFFCEIVIPFFYDQTYFTRKGFWPRSFFSHGPLGLLENYYECIIRPGANKYKLTVDCIKEFKKILENELNKKSLLSVILRNKELVFQNKKEKQIEYQWNDFINIIFSKKISDYSLCLACDKWFKNCHRKAFKGIKAIKQKIKQYNINI